MMLLAAGWTWPAAVVGLALIGGVTTVLTAMFRGPSNAPGRIAPKRLDAIEDDLLAIRGDLAEIKASIAELDRLFKSVG